MEEKKYPIGGFAPGNYQCNCCKCGTFFIGDKRAVECEPCALTAKEKFDALSPEEQAEVIKRNVEAVNEVFKDWGKKPDVNLAIIGHGEPQLTPEAITIADYEEILADHRRMIREIDVIMNGEKAAQQATLGDIFVQLRKEWPKRQSGPVWVKVEFGKPETFPPNEIEVFIKFNKGQDKHVGDVTDIDDLILKWDDVEWLDESGAPAAGREEDAVAFAEWAIREGWTTSHDRTGWMKHSDETPYVLTTAELYEQFKQ